ncbi:MAG: hypothetical protein CMK59_09195 [Proteobacteria bacterium]|nr:hypothetical protein [Pseudomonadota bacterium]
MNCLKTIIPLVLTLGPHVTLLGLFQLSAKQKIEHSDFETHRSAQFTSLPTIWETVNTKESTPAESISEDSKEHLSNDDKAIADTDNPIPTHRSSNLKKEKHTSQRHSKRQKCNSSPYVKHVSSQSYTLDQTQFDHLLNSPQDATKLAKVSWSTNSKTGLIRGVRIKNIPCTSPLRAMGLAPGMLVTHINDQELKSNADLYRAYRTVKKSKSFSLRLKRSGNTIQRLYTLSNTQNTPL